MRYLDSLPENLFLKVQALILAVIIWGFITMGQEKTEELAVPVVLANVPSRIKIANPPPPELHVTMSGPRYTFMGFGRAKPAAVLDLKGAGTGTVAFSNLDRYIRLREEVRVTRVQPSRIELTLVPAE